MFAQTHNVKYMNVSEISDLKKKIDQKIEKGDFVTLGKMLKVDTNAARMRYHRQDSEAVIAMEKIIDTREQLITSHQNQ